MAKIRSRLFQVRKQYELRAGRKVPVVEVAEKTGVNRKALYRLEKADKIDRLDMDILEKLCTFYGVGVGDILEYDPNGILTPGHGAMSFGTS